VSDAIFARVLTKTTPLQMPPKQASENQLQGFVHNFVEIGHGVFYDAVRDE
jgi:hypothetical protein